MVVIPQGALVTGAVVSAEQSGRVKGRASIALRFHEVTVMKTAYQISTSRIAREAEATKGKDAKTIGITTGVGTAIGAIAGGGKARQSAPGSAAARVLGRCSRPREGSGDSGRRDAADEDPGDGTVTVTKSTI